jgi:hypothetical protein
MKKKGGRVMKFFDEKKERGQFFLIAAVIIIVVVVSIVTITNYTEKKDTVKLYDLGQELGIESQNVLDYGTYSQLNDSQMNALMQNFIQNYVSYIQDKKNIYFIYGNSQQINVVGYQEIINESVCVNINKNTCAPYLTIGQTQQFPIGTGTSKVGITVGGTEYDFKLQAGENFYFVIWENSTGQRNVVTSDNGQ